MLLTYRRLLPLGGGSNFRDLGGYPTESGLAIRRGDVFRSGAMSGLTPTDETYLNQFGFKAVVDLRSREEIALFPNNWAQRCGIEIFRHDYSIEEIVEATNGFRNLDTRDRDYLALYRWLLEFAAPQFKIFFKLLLQGTTPVVINCSAGQDRTGIACALFLTALGVPEDWVVEDYLLSTDFRSPKNEIRGVDLADAAKDNAFATLMLGHHQGRELSRPNPLLTSDGKPLIKFVLEKLRTDYGGIESYLSKVLKVNGRDVSLLRQCYLD